MIHYRPGGPIRINGGDKEIEALLKQERALDAAYEAAFALHWEHELGMALWLAAQWEIDGAEFGAPREDWDTEYHRRLYVDDLLDHAMRNAALNHRGLP